MVKIFALFYLPRAALSTGEKVVVHKHEGHIQSRIVYYLMNIHIVPRTIYLTRVSFKVQTKVKFYTHVKNLQHGESEQNLVGRIGGDSDLSPRGRQYGNALSQFIISQNIPHIRVWTSWLKRTIQTVAGIPAPQERWKALNEIDAVRSTDMINK
jgi:6-phosphofructo-2-kinase / fructose-2,6-biphosphatase 2